MRYVCGVLVTVGTALFLVSIPVLVRTYMHTWKIRPRSLWLLLSVLVFGFLSGYLVFAYHIVDVAQISSVEVLVSSIFFGGAIYVLVSSRLFLETTRRLGDALSQTSSERDNLKVESGSLRDEVSSYRYQASEAHRQRLEQIGLLAAGIAHDFNNLLTGITANIEFLRDPGTQSTDYSATLSQIELATKRASDLTGQLLAYCGKASKSSQIVDLNSIATELVSLIQTNVPPTIRMTLELADELPDVLGDPTLLRQVFMNIVSNAVDSLHERGGVISITSRTVSTDDSEPESPKLPAGQYVTVTVRDDGPGISMELLPRIWDPFFTTKSKGRGLGLSAVQGIVSSHGGSIDVESVIDQGTVVHVQLPVAEQTIAPIEPVLIEKHPRKPDARILVVDDEVMILIAVQRGLEIAGYEVSTADNRADLIHMLESIENPFALAVLDVTMPEISFRELLQLVRNHSPGIPVVVSTGYSEENIHDLISNEKNISYLPKPFTSKEMLAIVRRTIVESHVSTEDS